MGVEDRFRRFLPPVLYDKEVTGVLQQEKIDSYYQTYQAILDEANSAWGKRAHRSSKSMPCEFPVCRCSNPHEATLGAS